MGGKTSAKSKNAYNARAYDRISFIVPKGEGDRIKAAAAAAGQSTNAFIYAAVCNRMDTKKGDKIGT